VSASAPTHRFPRLDKYELIEELGHGGMATVYRARDLRLEREVAVKVIHNHLRDNAEVRGRFVAEAKAVAKLRHPGIVDVYDVSSDADEERYLVVELIRGTTLRKLLDDNGALPAEIGAIIAAQLCDAVQHAHDASVIHRDIKPENVLIDRALGSERPSSPREGASSSGAHRVRVKLADFGIAKVLDAQGVTSTGQILGSPAHMAPEQIEGGTIAATTDVFALGVLFYECVVGHLPFQGSNPAQVLRRVLACEFEPADSARPQVGGRWAALVAKALSLNPADRYASAAEFGHALEDELAALGVDEPKKLLDAYFAEPAEFAERHEAALVPKLLSRGEAARERGDVHGAAADFNRALALRPEDLTIIKRLNAVTAAREWTRRLARLGAITAGAIVLGGASFGVARLVRGASVGARADRPVEATNTLGTSAPSPELRVPSVAPRPADPAVAPALDSVPSSEARVAALPNGGGSSSRTPSASSAAMARGPARRKVRFTVNPAGARLRLDGADVSWFGSSFDLSPGTHEVTGYMPDNNACCTRSSLSIVVTEPPREEPDQAQSFSVALGFNDARVSLSGAPPNAHVSCDNGLVFGGGQPGVVRMTDVERKTTCTFVPGGRKQSVKLAAGGLVVVPWPG